ncbi:MAG: tyrosine-type recombinase/integrase [Thermoflavifilum sp.]|nr:tyrosine-type recombinase/integrase [Thermoflavifilum sp.]MCL6513965.1 tyrosine-type recombinase/integrase [Alicyclobacillus sp.]
MSYATELAQILSSVTKSSQTPIRTVEDGICAYVINYARRGCSMRTIRNAYVDLKRFAEDVAYHENAGRPVLVTDVTRHVIEAHLSRLAIGQEIKCTRKPSPHTVERRRRVVKAFMRWLYSEEYIPTDPTKKLSSVPLRERFPSVWTLDDVDRFLHTFDTTSILGHRDYVIAVLALSSGLRAGELAHLRPIDVDLKSRTLKVSDKGKTGARTAVMTIDAVKELSRWLRRRQRELNLPDDAPLFPRIGSNGNMVWVNHLEPMRASSISYIIAKHAEQAGIRNAKKGAHALRHTAATFLAQNGASAFDIQRFLGHSSIEMSQRYVTMSNETVQRRVEKAGVLAQLERIRRERVDSNQTEVQLKNILRSR